MYRKRESFSMQNEAIVKHIQLYFESTSVLYNFIKSKIIITFFLNKLIIQLYHCKSIYISMYIFTYFKKVIKYNSLCKVYIEL